VIISLESIKGSVFVSKPHWILWYEQTEALCIMLIKTILQVVNIHCS